jgi:uncharacterized membrane protein
MVVFQLAKPIKSSYYSVITIIFLLMISASIGPIITTFELGPSHAQGARARAFDFTFEFRTSKSTIDPKQEGIVEIWLNNTGDTDDSFTLTLDAVPTGWTASFYDDGKLSSNPTFDVGGKRYKVVQVYVKAPESGKITLSANSKSISTSIVHSSSISIEAKFVFKILLKDPNNVHLVSGGEGTEFNLEIKNYQDKSDKVTLSLDNKFIKIQDFPDDNAWSAAFDNSTFTIEADSTKDVVLTVYAPHSGQPGDSITLIVLLDPESTTQEFKLKQDLVAKIPTLYNITYTLKQGPELPFPNSTVNYTLRLFNMGNVDDTITLDLHENLNNWDVYFYLEEQFFNPNVDSVDMDINEFVEFHVEIFIPLFAKSEAHSIKYGIYSQGKGGNTPVNEIDIITQVKLISDIDIVVPGGSGTIVDLQKTSYLNIRVSNKGNGLDTMTIELPAISIPAGWEIYFYSVKNTDETNTTKTVDFTEPIEIDTFEPIEYLPVVSQNYASLSLVLAADQMATVKLAIRPPDSGKPGTETFKVYGESVSGNIDTVTKSISVTLRVSDLLISELKIDPEEPAPDEEVTVKFNITNRYSLPAENFNVKLIEINENGVITDLGSKNIAQLNANESIQVSFKWTPKKVSLLGYILKAELNGDIIPKDNNTPTRTKNAFVKERAKEDDSSQSMLMIGLVIVIIVVIVILIIVLLTMRKQEKTPTEGEDEGEAKDPRISNTEKDVEPSKGKRKGSSSFKDTNSSKSSKVSISDLKQKK